ncbi:MAG: cupin domain-containing protein [Actinomycetota bacterium]
MEVELEAVGRNLAELRASRGLSLRELGELTGYTSSYLSQVERGASVPSLSGLATMAAALGVEMAVLFEQAAGPRIHVSRADEPLQLRTATSESGEPSHRYSVLGAHGNEGAYTALVHELPPDEASVQFRHFGERFCLVLEGSVRITIEGEKHELTEGDWLHYASHTKHSIEVTSDTKASVLWIVSPAIF